MKAHQKGLLGSVLALFILPFFFRRRMRVFRRTFIAAPPETVFAYLHNLRNWPLWRECNKHTASPYFSYSGPATGAGAVQNFETASRQGTLRLTASAMNDHLAYTISFDGQGTAYEGILALRPVRRGTWVRWVLKWEGNSSAPLRYADLWRMVRMGRQMTGDLEALRRLAETSPAAGGIFFRGESEGQ